MNSFSQANRETKTIFMNWMFIKSAANASSPLRRRSGTLASAAIICFTLLSCLGSAPAQDNPFERVAQQNYAGRFQGEGIELRLLPEAGKWTGTVLLKGKNYTVAAEVKGTGLEGQYAEGGQAWPFTGTVNGEQFNFTAGTFTTTLTRQHLPKLDGRWHSEHVLLILDQTGGPYTGRIQFNGTEYAFAAEEKAGDLEGGFKSGEKSFPFRLANEARGLVFNTGSFAEVITSILNRGTLRVQTIPAVPFTLFNNGKQIYGQDGAFELAGGQTFTLELKAKRYQSVKTNLTVPNYGEVTWTVNLEEFPYPKLDKPLTNSLGMRFVPVAGTKVLFGVWDVRVQDYHAYAVANSGLDNSWQNPGFAQGDSHPVVNVSWDDAKGFCQWLTEQERADGIISSSQSYRLPTDAEWSVAVGLGNESGSTPKEKDDQIKDVYPWGTSWPPPSGAGNYDPSLNVDSFAKTSPVGSFAPNQFGLSDMGGNVWQWCEDFYDGNSGARVLRGASWYGSDPRYLLSSYRGSYAPDYRGLNFGFRCVLVGGSAP